ncbi:hypothetical protein SK128_003550 [Halocaridina rubra]|uniref:Uncharacterized protein n=2 Tax=Halocaridina rubra TaxID=373956 RepID=A0AAN8X3T3_HALRR
MNDVPRAFSTPNPSPQPPPPRPPPLLPSSPSHKPLPAPSQGLPSQPLPDIQPSATSSVPPQHHHGLPSHPLPLPSVVSSVPPQHHHVASPLNETYKPNAVTNITPVSPQNPPPSGHSAPVPHHSITPHQALSPKHPISPSAHSSMLPRHPNLSPHGPVPHSPNHPVLSPHHRLSASSQSPVSPYPSSQSSPSAHHPVPVSYHAMPPRHSIVHPPSHPPSSPHLPMPVASGHTPVPHRLPASHSSHYPETWASYHPMPVYTRQVSVSSSQSETTVSPEYIEDEVFSSKAQEPLTNTHISQANPQQYPTQQLTPKEQTHQGTSSTNNHPHQVHAVYPPGAYVRSPPNEVHSQHIPLSVLQYSQQGYNSQMTQQQPTSASHNSHIPSHYPTDPQHPPQVHNSVQYQRSAYPQPYALSYYHPNNHHPPPHPAQPAYRPPYRPNVPHHYPQSIPNHAYRPHIPPRNPVLQNQLRNPTSRGPVRFAPQPPVPLTTSDWNSADGERLEMTNSPIKPSA